MSVDTTHTLTDTQIEDWMLSLANRSEYQSSVKPFQLPTALLSLNEKMQSTMIGA